MSTGTPPPSTPPPPTIVIGRRSWRTWSGRRARPAGLPDDLVDRSIRHVVRIALGFGTAVLVALALNTAMFLAGGRAPFAGAEGVPLPTVPTVARAAFVLASAAMVLVGRSGLDRRMKADVALAYEVLGAGMVALTERTMLPEMGVPLGAISAVSLWIFLARVIAPTSTGRAAVAATLSAAMVPLAGAATHAGGAALATSTVLTTFGTAALAVWASRMIHRLGAEVSEARELGSYRLERRLGTGGMGEVWLARHRLLQRPAAIKLIRPDALGRASPSEARAVLARFEDEARATAELTSIHTIQVFDFGLTHEGSFYYVMELLDGLDLDTLVRTHGPVPAERAVHILAQICESLAEAHRRGFIHRDVKPANVFLCRLGLDHDFVKVLDFGLVWDMGPSAEPRGRRIAGTPAFIAPEVVLQNAPIGPATDIYMLGCVGWWLLTGHLPFEGTTAEELVAGHVHTPPRRASLLAELPVPDELDELILACLAKNPADRPQDALELAGRLRAIDLPAPWTPERARRWWDAHRPRRGTP